MMFKFNSIAVKIALGLVVCPFVVMVATSDAGDDLYVEWHRGLPKQPWSDWLVHDQGRPKPERVMPGATAASPPSDAVVLFDGADLDAFVGKDGEPAAWAVDDGAMAVNGTGDVWTRREFGDVQLHVEFATPDPPAKDGQSRGNSGLFFMDRYELQIVDNHDNPTYADGYVGAVYGQHPPRANAVRKPGEWNTYDVVFIRPRFEDSKVVTPGRLTVFLNGVLVQHYAEIFGPTGWRKLPKPTPHPDRGTIRFQDHNDGQSVRFRNVWVRELE